MRDIISTRQKSRKLLKKNGRRVTKTGSESGVMTQGLNSLDMNGDDVPEMVRVGVLQVADGATVATCTPDGIREEEIYRIGMWYIPGGNVLDNNDGNMGVFYDRVFEIKDGEWLQIGDGECRMEDNTNPEYDENGGLMFSGINGDGKEVTNKKYEKKLKKLFGNRKPEALGNEAVSYHEIINQISHY